MKMVKLVDFLTLLVFISRCYAFEDSFRSQSGTIRELALSDFESGTMSPWNDESAADVHWVVEDVSSPIESNAAPNPTSGSKYLRGYRLGGASGTAVLRSPSFTVYPGDKFYLSFWIRSFIQGTNNIDIYWMNGNTQERILSLAQYSSPSNFEWREESALIPVSVPSTTRISIYGITGSDNLDAIAIDNIVILPSNTTTTTSQSSSTTAITDTTSTTTPGSTTCPTNLGPNQVKCWTLGGKCYCFSLYKVDDWFTGETYCKSNGANLISLETQTETTLIDNHISGSSSGLDKWAYWTSGQYQGSGFTWTGSGQSFSYTNWYTGQPDDNKPGFCVRMFYGSGYNGQWSDIDCTGADYLPFYFICEL